MTNLPQLFEKYRHHYVENKYFQLALGFHPELVYQYRNQQMLFKELINETRFIGEIGLDYTKKTDEDIICQTKVFEKILEWSSGTNKILSVHSRSAAKKVVDMINDFDGTVILHWYSGGVNDLKSAMGRDIELIIPENGLISLNIPLAYTRTGTSSTRTTHPHYMKMLQELIIELGIRVKINNPFQFKTKGEMIIECKDREFLQTILDKTMSCSHPDIGRYQGMKKTMHCGYCLPCTIRRASIQKGRLQDTSIYFDTTYKALPIARQAYRTYKYAFNNFDENSAFLKIQESGPIVENIEEFANLYVRGMKEMRECLEKTNV